MRQRDRNPLRAANFIQVEWVRRCSACSKKSLPRCIDERAASNEERAGKARFFFFRSVLSLFFCEYSLLATRPLALFHSLRLFVTNNPPPRVTLRAARLATKREREKRGSRSAAAGAAAAAALQPVLRVQRVQRCSRPPPIKQLNLFCEPPFRAHVPRARDFSIFPSVYRRGAF